jgi:polysaccharide export outer membrane protein
MPLPTLVAAPEEDGASHVPPPPPPEGYNLFAPLPLLPGDRIEITVREDPDLNIPIEISPDGTFEVYKSDKDGGPRRVVEARGKTVQELKEEIADIYKEVRFSFRPYVQVSLASSIPRTVDVRGAIESKGGTVEIFKNGARLTLLRAIRAAGTLSEDADLSRVKIERRDPATGALVSLPTYDLEKMEEDASYDRDPPLEPGDVITVPSLGYVHIFGNINNPGAYLCKRRMTLTKLIADAGGYKPFSKLTDVRVIRDEGTAREAVYTVNVRAILNGEGPYDPILKAGDRIFIEESVF